MCSLISRPSFSSSKETLIGTKYDKTFNIPNYAKYSAEDQEACASALEIFTENGKWVTPPRLKETDEIRNNYLNGIKKLPEVDK